MVLSLEVFPLLSEFMHQIDLLTTLYGDDDDDDRFPSMLYSRMNLPGDLDVNEDSLVAIAVATLLFISSQAPDRKQSFLSSEKTIDLIENLLQVTTV
jgi:hypothetical protein